LVVRFLVGFGVGGLTVPFDTLAESFSRLLQRPSIPISQDSIDGKHHDMGNAQYRQ
jgi:hypothetical protein